MPKTYIMPSLFSKQQLAGFWMNEKWEQKFFYVNTKRSKKMSTEKEELCTTSRPVKW